MRFLGWRRWHRRPGERRGRRHPDHGLRPGRRRERLAHGQHQVDPGSAAKAAGIDLKFSDAQQKQENQIKAIRSFIQQGSTSSPSRPVVETGWDAVLQEAKDANIPVILTDRAVDTEDTSLYVTFIGSDFVKEGERAGEWVVEAVRRQHRADQHRRARRAPPARRRPTTARRASPTPSQADPKFKIDRLADRRLHPRRRQEGHGGASSRYDAEASTCVFAHNDDMALGAIEAIEAAGKKPGKDIKIVSIDAVKDGMQALADGKINFIVECNPLLGAAADGPGQEGPRRRGRCRAAHRRPRTTTFDQEQARRPSCPTASTDPPLDRRPQPGDAAGAGSRASTASERSPLRSPRGSTMTTPPDDEPGAPPPVVEMTGHHHRVPGRQGARRRRLPPAPRRGARAHGRERRRQVDADQGAHRRLRASTPARSPSTARATVFAGPAQAQARRHQHRVPGGQPLPEPVGRREHHARPRAAPLRADRLARDAPPGRRAARPASTCDIDPGSLLGDHSLAVQQLVAIGRAMVVDAAGAHPRRADLQPRRRRGRRAVPRSSARCATGASRSCSSRHFLDQVYEISDRITVLRNGRLVGEYRDGDAAAGSSW